MPGRAPRALPPPEPSTAALATRLERHVRALADEIGARHVGAPDALRHAQRLIETRFRDTGWDVDLQPFEAGGVTVANVEARVRDSSSPFVVVGAHYDTVPGTPGANDNGTGVAALMELAGILREAGTFDHVRLVAFVNEEPPWFQTAQMGSTVYAARARAQGDRVTGMLSLETIGYYSEAPGSQRYPAPLDRLFPDTGHFLGAVSESPVRAASATLHARLPRGVAAAARRCAGGVAPAWRRMVRPLVILAAWLSSLDAHGHRAVPIPALPPADRHAGPYRLRAPGLRSRGDCRRDCRPRGRRVTRCRNQTDTRVRAVRTSVPGPAARAP